MKCSKFSFLFHVFDPSKVELVCIWSSTWLALNRGSRFVCTFPDPRNAAEARTSPPRRLKESVKVLLFAILISAKIHTFYLIECNKYDTCFVVISLFSVWPLCCRCTARGSAKFSLPRANFFCWLTMCESK